MWLISPVHIRIVPKRWRRLSEFCCYVSIEIATRQVKVHYLTLHVL